jgi:hypothetical protein
VLWVTLGIILGGRTGYVLFYNPTHFLGASNRGRAVVEGRHVFSRRLRRLRAGGRAVRAAARHLDPVARRPHLRDRNDWLFLGRIANFINGELWGRPADVPWAMVFPGGGPLPRHPSQLYEAALEGLVLCIALWLLMRAGALKRPGLVIGAFAGRLLDRADHLRVLPRARSAARISLGGNDHGHAAVGAADAHRFRLHGRRLEAAAAASLRPMATTPLEAEIRRRIQMAGPMPVRQYMELCLSHPVHGYYTTRDPLGRGGDFITAPEISQVFGELLGLWAASAWHRMGQPENVRLVEIGPGRGTMMLDALRAAQVVPAFPRRSRAASGRDQPGAAGAAAAGDGHARRAGDVASDLRRGAGRTRPSCWPTNCSTPCR